MEKTYIKVTLPGSEKGFFCEPGQIADIISAMVEIHEDGSTEVYEFATVSMSEEEFNQIPEFTGF